MPFIVAKRYPLCLCYSFVAFKYQTMLKVTTSTHKHTIFMVHIASPLSLDTIHQMAILREGSFLSQGKLLELTLFKFICSNNFDTYKGNMIMLFNDQLNNV